MAAIDEFLRETVQRDGSDLHISVDLPPLIRYRGELIPTEHPPLTRAETRALILELLTPDQREYLEKNREMDFAYKIPGLNRFRCSVFYQRLGLDGTFHVIPNVIPKLHQIGLPSIVTEFTMLNQGLLLVAGPRGCGKSTTQAAIIDHINCHGKKHIITVEEPIEFIHTNRLSLINQREVGLHTGSFAGALRQSLRADPDIILVGEMRDLETISMAITAAETGHLVLGTLHTTNAVQTIDRIIDVFPGTQKLQIRMMVSESLRGIICQQLIRSIREDKMEIAAEILVGTPSIANLIRESKTYQIPSIIQMGANLGMITMDDSLLALLRDHRISYEDAILRATDKKKFLRFAPVR
jgi:twitching motility protein PilT